MYTDNTTVWQSSKNTTALHSLSSGPNIRRIQSQSDEQASFEIDNEGNEMVNNIRYLGVHLNSNGMTISVKPGKSASSPGTY